MVIRYTEHDDMRTHGGQFKALADIKAFRGKRISLWGSIRCAAGSPWQCVNEVHYYSGGDHRSLRGFRGIWTDFRYLLWNFMKIARAVVETGGTVCIVWPSQCQWLARQKRKLHEHSMDYCIHVEYSDGRIGAQV
eukprot:7217643-Pyramimonas_sp.AAC.1